jgi:hypothetical protein
MNQERVQWRGYWEAVFERIRDDTILVVWNVWEGRYRHGIEDLQIQRRRGRLLTVLARRRDMSTGHRAAQRRKYPEWEEVAIMQCCLISS